MKYSGTKKEVLLQQIRDLLTLGVKGGFKTVIHFGTVLPAGKEGDVFINTNTKEAYKYISGWQYQTTLDSNYTYQQLVPAATWLITHNLNKFPSVTIIDNGIIVEAAVEYIDLNTVLVEFYRASQPFNKTGTITLN